MKKITAFVLALIFAFTLTACSSKSDKTTDVPKLSEISNFTQVQLEEKLLGLSNEELHSLWGEPDYSLSGLWGDIWYSNDEHSQEITVYYDDTGAIALNISNIADDTEE